MHKHFWKIIIYWFFLLFSLQKNDFVYFMFPFINGLKKLLNVLHFKFVITFRNVFLLIFFGSLVDATFSNLKVDFFIITGFIRNMHILGKKVSLIVFRYISSKILPLVHIFSFTIMTYLKKLTGIKSLNTKQCLAGFSSRIIPSPPVSPRVYLLQKDNKIKWF